MSDRDVRIHPDRTHLDPWVLGGLIIGCGLLGAMTARAALATIGLGAGASVIGALATLALIVGARSISVRGAAFAVVALSAVVQARMGVMDDSSLVDSQTTLLWVVAAAAVLVLADLADTSTREPMQGWTPPRDRDGMALRVGGTVVGLVLFVLVVAPMLLALVSSAAQSGQGPRLQADGGGGPAIRASDSLDMTTRPDLSDEIMFTVRADRGTFWRGQVYDEWDGRHWTRSDPRRFPLDGAEVVPASDDLGASGEDVLTQRFRMEATYSDVVLAAASPVSIEARHAVVQGADGTLVTAGVAMGRDSAYTVVSRRPSMDETTLRTAPDDVPGHIMERYASMPVASERVLSAAREATTGATNDYDRVRALEEWMGDRTEYSLDAPLSPEGVDVVDHFLFDSRQGWCEQVASSLVVMARANGIPARLVTGFVPGDLDRLTGTYVVRAMHAHAWAEIWFADVGWVSFDPTAEVPLAGSDPSEISIGRWILDHALLLLVAGAALALTSHGIVNLVKWWRARRAARPVGWVAVADARLVAVGKRVDWQRADSETASRFARSLALHLGDGRLVEVGAAIDDALYAPFGPDDARRAHVDQILDSLVDVRPPPDTADDHRGGAPDGDRGDDSDDGVGVGTAPWVQHEPPTVGPTRA